MKTSKSINELLNVVTPITNTRAIKGGNSEADQSDQANQGDQNRQGEDHGQSSVGSDDSLIVI